MASSWGSSWGSAWGNSWGATGTVTTPTGDKTWPWIPAWGKRRGFTGGPDEPEDDFRRQFEEEAADLIAEAVEDGKTDTLIERPKSLKQLLLKAPVLDDKPAGISAAEVRKMVADVQRDIAQTLKRIQEAEDEEDALLLLT